MCSRFRTPDVRQLEYVVERWEPTDVSKVRATGIQDDEPRAEYRGLATHHSWKYACGTAMTDVSHQLKGLGVSRMRIVSHNVHQDKLLQHQLLSTIGSLHTYKNQSLVKHKSYLRD